MQLEPRDPQYEVKVHQEDRSEGEVKEVLFLTAVQHFLGGKG